MKSHCFNSTSDSKAKTTSGEIEPFNYTYKSLIRSLVILQSENQETLNILRNPNHVSHGIYRNTCVIQPPHFHLKLRCIPLPQGNLPA